MSGADVGLLAGAAQRGGGTLPGWLRLLWSSSHVAALCACGAFLCYPNRSQHVAGMLEQGLTNQWAKDLEPSAKELTRDALSMLRAQRSLQHVK
eukprot:123002-Rhodomonas_salina.1